MSRFEWTLEETTRLGMLVFEHGPHWRYLSTHYFPGRSDDSVRHQYRRSFVWVNATPRVERNRTDLEECTELALVHLGDWTRVQQAMRDIHRRPPSYREWQEYVSHADPARMKLMLDHSWEVGIVLDAIL